MLQNREGQRVPQVSFRTRAAGEWKTVTTDDLFKGRTVVVFSLAMGSLWLATVPLTSGLVAHIYGLRYMGTLYGIVFFSHQLAAADSGDEDS